MSFNTFTQIIPLKYIIIYVIGINIIGFFAMLIDKQKAKRGSWRIPEKTLFTITLLGGGIGAIAGMYLFRHKTKKLYFTIGFPVILISETALIVYWIVAWICITKYTLIPKCRPINT